MAKVGDCMDSRELAKMVIVSRGGVAKSADFVAAGIRAVDVVNMCNAGYLERVRHGYYSLARGSIVSEEQILVELIKMANLILSMTKATASAKRVAPRSLHTTSTARPSRG